MEIALCCNEKIYYGDSYIFRKLRGDILIAIPKLNIRRTWVQMCGQLLCPEKRDKFKNISVYKPITEAWKQSWRDTAIAMFRNEIIVDQAFANLMEDNFPDLGADPKGDVALTSTWLWSEWERRNFYLGSADSENPSLADKIRYKSKDVEIVGSSHTINYRKDFSLSIDDINEIENLDKKIDPDLRKIWSSSLIIPVCNPEDIIYPDEPED